MTELKTLKDLTPVKTGKYELLKLNCGKDFVPIDELKAEAVKWVKNLDERIKQDDEIKHNSECWRIVKLWFVEFFNLTEEDLIGSVNNERRKNEN